MVYTKGEGRDREPLSEPGFRATERGCFERSNAADSERKR